MSAVVDECKLVKGVAAVGVHAGCGSLGPDTGQRDIFALRILPAGVSAKYRWAALDPSVDQVL